jgi:Notch-like protein
VSCNNGNCVYKCSTGYNDTGNACEKDYCSPNPCKNGGTCSNGSNKAVCTCASGYTGDTCSTKVNPCGNNVVDGDEECDPTASGWGNGRCSDKCKRLIYPRCTGGQGSACSISGSANDGVCTYGYCGALCSPSTGCPALPAPYAIKNCDSFSCYILCTNGCPPKMTCNGDNYCVAN